MDEYQALHTLALRLVSQREDIEHDARLLPARLPDGLPFELPVPEGATLIGSFMRSGHTRVLLDTSLSIEQVEALYRARLSEQGFHETEFGYPAYFPSSIGPMIREDLGLDDSETAATEGTHVIAYAFERDESPLVSVEAWGIWDRMEEMGEEFYLFWFALRLPVVPQAYFLHSHVGRPEASRPWLDTDRTSGGVIATVTVTDSALEAEYREASDEQAEQNAQDWIEGGE